MNKTIYTLSIFFGLGLVVYFYFFNFDNMSETELINSVLYWYVPLIFGLYGFTAIRIKTTIDASNQSTIKHFFSWKDNVLTIFAIILLILGGFIGIVLFFLPLIIFKVKSDYFDIKVSIFGTLLWLVTLYVFFEAIWPSL